MTREQANPSPQQTTAEVRACYRMDPAHSRFTVQGFAAGMLSFLGHSPTFAVRYFKGMLCWQPDTSAEARLEVTVRADSLVLVDNVRPADRAEIEGRMRGEVLAVADYPEIHFEATEIAATNIAGHRYRLRLTGRLTLHGITNRQAIDAEILLYHDGSRLIGEFPLRLSDYRIQPVTALGGAIQVRDELRVSFDIVAWKEVS
jgi:polyisoprenoid-binding protein YceI